MPGGTPGGDARGEMPCYRHRVRDDDYLMNDGLVWFIGC